MSIRYHVLHETVTTYHRTVTLSQQFLHMTPRSFAYQTTESHALSITPKPQDWSNRIDYFGNATRLLTLSTPHPELTVVSDSVVTLEPRPDRSQLVNSPTWEDQRARLRTTVGAATLDPYEFLFNSPHIACGDELAEYAHPSFTPGRPLLEACMDLTERIHTDFKYDPEATTIATPLIDVLRGPGFCACDDRLSALARLVVPLCQRLYPDHAARGSTTSGGGRCLPCLGLGVQRRAGLDRF